ncbi:MAG: hypothetical protein ACP5IJ_01890 [Candidatus Nanoarchaeia archaeon]
MLIDIKRLLGKEGIESIKKDIDNITKFESKVLVDVQNLEEPLKTIGQFVLEKERLEHARNTLIKLLEMSAELRRELQETNKRCAIILDHAKIHFPGRESARFELAKCKAKEDALKFTLSYIDAAIARFPTPEQLATKLLDVEERIAKFGGDRALIAIEEIIKRPAIQRGDLVEIARRLK